MFKRLSGGQILFFDSDLDVGGQSPIPIVIHKLVVKLFGFLSLFVSFENMVVDVNRRFFFRIVKSDNLDTGNHLKGFPGFFDEFDQRGIGTFCHQGMVEMFLKHAVFGVL